MRRALGIVVEDQSYRRFLSLRERPLNYDNVLNEDEEIQDEASLTDFLVARTRAQATSLPPTVQR